MPKTQDTLLHLALRHSDSIATHLVTSGASLFVKNAKGKTPDDIAVASNDPNFNNLKNKTYLAAARASNVPSLRECLAHGVDVNYVDPTSGNSALHEAYRAKESPEKQLTIDFLLSQQIDVSLVNAANLLAPQRRGDDTVFDQKVIADFIKQVQQGKLSPKYSSMSLEALRAYLNKATGDTLLHEVIRSPMNDQDGCELILYLCSAHRSDYKIDNFSYIKNKNGHTAKQLATDLNKAAYVTAIQQHQMTPLFRSINYYNIQGIKNFIEDAGDVNVLLDGTGETVLNYALGQLYYHDELDKKFRVIRYLVTHGANVNLRLGVLDSPINRTRGTLRSWDRKITTYPAYAESLRLMKTKDTDGTIIDTILDPLLIKANTITKWDLLFIAALFLLWKYLPRHLFESTKPPTSLEFTKNIGSQSSNLPYNLMLTCFAILASIFLLYRCAGQEPAPAPQLQ